MKSIAMCASLLHFWKFEIGAQWQATIILQYNVYYRLCIYRVSPSQRMSQKTLYVCGNRFSTKLRRRVIFDLFLYRGIPTGPSITAINIVRLYPFFFQRNMMRSKTIVKASNISFRPLGGSPPSHPYKKGLKSPPNRARKRIKTQTLLRSFLIEFYIYKLHTLFRGYPLRLLLPV